MTERLRTSLAVCLALGALALAACSDDSVQADAGLDAATDLSWIDGGADSAPDSAGKDQQADLPLPNPRWILVPGAPRVLHHTATLLKDGRVLVSGGVTYVAGKPVVQAACWIYDPKTSTFTAAGKLGTERELHTASLLPSGKVLVTGGQSETDYLETTELFDPSKPAAQAWTAGPKMFKPRWSHVATTLKDGRVLISGGFTYSDSTATVLLYDPASNSFKVPGKQMKAGRKSHTATLLKNGKVLLAGGTQGASSSPFGTTYLKSMEIYDPTGGSFTQTKDMHKRRTGHSATLLPGGQVLIVGGYCGNKCTGDKSVNNLYDPATDSVSELSPPGSLPTSHVAALLPDGRVLVAGGGWGGSQKQTVAYSPGAGGSWDSLPDMPIGRTGARAVTLKDQTVLVVGGYNGTSPPYTYPDKAVIFSLY